jgi:hypothetical protein
LLRGVTPDLARPHLGRDELCTSELDCKLGRRSGARRGSR